MTATYTPPKKTDPRQFGEKRYDDQFLFKLPKELKHRFNQACWKRGKFAAEELRMLMDAYCKMADSK